MIRGRVSYANVAATVALVLAMSGGALAATGGFSSGGTLRACVNEEGTLKLLKPGKKCQKGQKAITWDQVGPAGATGAAGAAGTQGGQGAQGAQGAQGSPGAPGLPSESNVTSERIDVVVPAGREREEVVNLDGAPVLAACDVTGVATNAVALQAYSAPGLYWKQGGAVSTDQEGFQSDTNAMNIDVLLTPSSGRVGHLRLHATHEGQSCRVQGILTIVE
jgi:hypothetical protein